MWAVTLWGFFFFFLLDWLFWCGGKNWFLFTDFETGQVAESLIGFTSSLEPVASLGRVSIICKKCDTFVCPFSSTPHTPETCVVTRKAKDSAADWWWGSVSSFQVLKGMYLMEIFGSSFNQIENYVTPLSPLFWELSSWVGVDLFL